MANDVAEGIRAEVERASALLRAWTEADAGTDRGPGKWKPKEILGHLVDSALNNHQRFVRAQLTSRLVAPGYDQQAWVRVHRYHERAWAELVSLWVAANLHVASVVDAIPAEKMQTPCVIGENEPRPLEWWVRDYLRHLRHHLEQIVGA